MGSPFEGGKGDVYNIKKAVLQKNSFFYAYILVLIRKRLCNSTTFYFLQAIIARVATAYVVC